MKGKELVIIGCGGHGRTVLDVVLDIDPGAQVIFQDDNADSGEIIETKVPKRTFEVCRQLDSTSNREFFVAIGDNRKRRQVTHSLGGLSLATIVAKDATVGIDAEIGNGVFVGHLAVIGPFAKVGRGALINTRSHISHESTLGDFSQLTLDVTVGGRSQIGNDVYIGMRSCVFDGVTIGDNIKVGAGSVVTKSLEKPGTYIGSPARLIK